MWLDFGKSARPFNGEADRPRVASALGVSVDRLPAIGVSDRTSQPLTVGVIRPSILIPEGLAASLSADALRDVLIHECAHALRRDTLVGLLQRLAAILCWPNPLVHLMNRALESAREELCDNYVLRTSTPADYAASLLAVAERRPFSLDYDAMLSLPMIARRGTLESRIAALIDPRRHAETSMRRGAVAALAVLFLAAGAGVSAVRFGETEQPPAAPSSNPLDPKKTRIEGVVVDESGKPAADILVRSWSYWGEPPETRTGPDGRFVLDIDVVATTRLLASNADGSLQAMTRELGEFNSSRRRYEANLVLKPTRPTTVRVVDAQGAAVADAAVEIHDDAPWWSGRTDARGEARFQIPADAQVTAVIALKSGRGFDYFENDRGGFGLPSKPLPATIDLVLNGSTTVKVRAEDASGKPMPQVPFVPWFIKKAGKLDMVNLAGSRVARVATDRDGVAVFDFAPADLVQEAAFLVSARPLHMARTIAYVPTRPENATLTARVLRTVPVSGRVFATDGKPAPAIMVRAEGRGNTPHYGRTAARTGADGSYHLDLAPDQSYLIGVIDEDWAARSRGGIVPREGMTIQHVDFHLDRGTVFTGRVTTAPDHAPAVGETVVLSERGASAERLFSGVQTEVPWVGEERIETLLRWAKTDGDGRYAFRIGPGTFSKPDKSSPFDEPIQVGDEPEIVYDYQIDRPARSESIFVTVRKAGPNGAIASDALIVALRDRPSNPLVYAFAIAMKADSSGRLAMKRSRSIAGFYARSPDGSLAGYARLEPKSSDVTILLKPATKIGGRVVFSDGRPVPRARVQGELLGVATRDSSLIEGAKEDVGVLLETFADGEGRFDLLGVPVGVKVRLDSWWQGPVNRALGRRRGHTLPVTLEVKDAQPLTVPDLVVMPYKF